MVPDLFNEDIGMRSSLRRNRAGRGGEIVIDADIDQQRRAGVPMRRINLSDEMDV
jgi:hypothetical protein